MSHARWYSLALLIVASLTVGAGADAADIEAGKRLYNPGKACHELEAGKNQLGPSLAGIFGRKAGAIEEFKQYSEALKTSGVVWDDEAIDKYLADPRGFIKGNRMAFPGLKRPEDRANVIAYIKEATK